MKALRPDPNDPVPGTSATETPGPLLEVWLDAGREGRVFTYACGPHRQIRVGDLELDLVSRCAMRAGKQIPLTNRESALLEFLMTNSPRPMSKAMIVERVWDQYFDTQTNVVNVYVNYLRKKIDQPGLNPLIHTMRGAGFALRAS